LLGPVSRASIILCDMLWHWRKNDLF
jgi:hypothetical protein